MARVRAWCRRRWRFLSDGWCPMAAVPAGAPRGAQSAFRIQQEHACGHDLFALFKTGADFDAVSQLHAERDRPRFESVPAGDKDVLLQPCVNQRVTRNGNHLRSSRFKGNRSVEPRSEGSAGICRREADTQGARAFGEGWIDEVDTRGKRRAAGSWKFE